MKIFLDANVLVTILNKEYPVYADAVQVLSLVDKPGYKVFTSPLCIAIAWYFSAKKNGAAMAKKKITLLCSKIAIAQHNEEDIQKVCASPNITDVEDGLEYYSALNAGCDCIVTADTDDFYFSAIPVFQCRGFLEAFFSITKN
jgi:predicted nucleic acid-binding protein